MPDATVSSCVLQILGSFSGSLGLYKRLKEKRGVLRRGKKVEGEQEQRLSRSLRQGPEDISQEYQHNYCAAGDRFAVGDAIAQTSLAEVLLQLNVGLVGIINSFLTNDRKDVALDYKGLADLAERSRLHTCRTLRQLLERLTRSSNGRPQRLITAKGNVQNGSHVKAARSSNLRGNRKKNKVTPPRPKIRGPTLAQVVIQDSSKPPQIAMVRPGGRRKKSRSSSGSAESNISRQTANGTSLQKHNSPPASRPTVERAKTTPKVQKPPPRKPVMAPAATSRQRIGNDNALRATKSTPRLHATTQTEMESPLPGLPPPPATADDQAAALSTSTLPQPRRRPHATPTYYSIATDSTKLGEIPLHKWAQPYDFDRMELLNRQAYLNGWPNEACVEQGKRRGGGGLWGLLFRRRA